MNVSSRSLLAAALAVSLSLGSVVQAQTNDAPQSDRAAPMSSAKSNAPDAKFVEMASAAGLAEIDLGKLGASQGQSDAVKTFGQQMVDDHTKANDELKTIASSKSIPVSTAPMANDAKAATMIGSKQGAEFDSAFKKKMVADHEKAVKLFTKESTSGKDPELKAFASKTLPTLQHHLQMAQQLPSSSSNMGK
jgi:putative membrane protein